MGILILSAIVAMIFVMLLSTEKKGEWTIYTIDKGDHYSSRTRVKWPYKVSLCGNELTFKALFSHGCDAIVEGNDREDINKLYGINFGFDWHWRSVRIGWKWNDNLKMIELYSYSYIKSVRRIKQLTHIALYEPVDIKIKWYDNNCVTIDGKHEDGSEFHDIVNGIDSSAINFKLFPYFGGNKTAPQTMKIFISDERKDRITA